MEDNFLHASQGKAAYMVFYERTQKSMSYTHHAQLILGRTLVHVLERVLISFGAEISTCSCFVTIIH